MIRMMAVEMLEELGHSIAAEAGSLDKALELAQTTDFDLAVLDINLDGEVITPVRVPRSRCGCRVQKKGPIAASVETQPARSTEAKGLRVLLVDDDILVSMGAADMLLDLGHSVTEAQSGAHALKLLESDGQFDIVVTDYAMPGMNGFELAQRIKAVHPQLPIVLATGYAELPANRSIEFGYLSKPYTSKDLAAALEKKVKL